MYLCFMAFTHRNYRINEAKVVELPVAVAIERFDVSLQELDSVK